MLDIHNINYMELEDLANKKILKLVEKFRALGIKVVERKHGYYECFTSGLRNTRNLKGRDWKLKLLKLELPSLSLIDGVSVEHIASRKRFYFGVMFNRYNLIAANCLACHPKDVRMDQRAFFKMILFGSMYSYYGITGKKISEVIKHG